MTFRSVMGKTSLQIFLNVNFDDEEITIMSSLSALEDYFLPKRNVVYERYVFNSCIQTPEETVDSYVNRLKKLASSCQFGTLTEEMIRDRLVIGIQDIGSKARLRGALGFSVLRFWLFFRSVFRFFGFGGHCGLLIFRFLASGFRFFLFCPILGSGFCSI